MIYKKIKIEGIPAEVSYMSFGPNPEIVNSTRRPVMVVVPGGGYTWVSYREAEPVAARYLSEGFNCFVLTYTIKQKYPIPHLELARLINYIYTNAEELYCDKTKISVIGFSAGGHLVSSFGYLYPELAKEIGVEEKILRPFSITAAYPVTSTNEEFTHLCSIQTIAGNDQELLEKLSVEKHITKDYPPTFIWNTKDDECVPTKCSECFDQALTKAGVVHEYISYPKGSHGLSICTRPITFNKDYYQEAKETYSWVEKDIEFIYKLIDDEN